MDHLIQTITVYLLPVIFAITLHEAAHGYVARHFGDSTAYLAGRVSLNPLRHIDIIGTIIVPMAVLIVSLMTGGGPLMFGWAKPVPVIFGNLRQPKKDMMWVALAGPAMNLLMAFAWALLYKLQLVSGLDEPFFLAMATAGVRINIGFMLLNLIPIPPLDGGRVAVSLLPARMAWAYSRVEPFGFLIILVLMKVGVISLLLAPFNILMVRLILFTFALS